MLRHWYDPFMSLSISSFCMKNDWMDYASSYSVPSPRQRRGRFGTQVENIGDIDRDGFDDLAVSAPYVEDGEVYIFRGTQNGLSDFSQVNENKNPSLPVLIDQEFLRD